ncbi:MAG: hypothetical protein J5716_00880 [Alphaproteobacteria bacterium]|nr:hypothetical protein [Alphaproteobacteria bacterium]
MKKYLLLALLVLSGCSSNNVPIVFEKGNVGSGKQTTVSSVTEKSEQIEQSVIDDGIFRTDKTVLSYMPEGKRCRFKQSYGYSEGGKYSETDSRELLVEASCATFDFKDYTVYLKEKSIKNTLEKSEKDKGDKMLISFNQEGKNCVIEYSAGIVENGKYRETDIKQVTFGERECKSIIEDFILEKSDWIEEKPIKHPVKDWNFADRRLKKEAGKIDETVVSLKQIGVNCVYSRSYGWSLNKKSTETDFKQMTFGNTQCASVLSLVKNKIDNLNKQIKTLRSEEENIRLQAIPASKEQKAVYAVQLRELEMKISGLKQKIEKFIFKDIEGEMTLKNIKQPLIKKKDK